MTTKDIGVTASLRPDQDTRHDEYRQRFIDAELWPLRYYIDRRIGVDPSLTKSNYLGRNWIDRDFDRSFLVEVEINEHGFFVEVAME